MPLLSTKQIPWRERLIVALDVESVGEAKALVEELGEAAIFYKVGLGLAFDRGFWELFDFLREKGKKAFADIKFFDVPETVKAAVRKMAGSGAAFATVHAQDGMIRAAVEARNEAGESGRDLKILAVTVLTSLDQGDLKDMGFAVTVEDLVLSRAKRMLEHGCDGVISSGLEASRLRSSLGDNLLIVVPGIRPVENSDDQKRTVDVEDAFKAGADYIVVGRPIRNAGDRAAAAAAIQARIARLFPA
ncbi:MAG: orotidine-5'-phosphate decarboxylase [Terriglobales bacterium]